MIITFMHRALFAGVLLVSPCFAQSNSDSMSQLQLEDSKLQLEDFGLSASCTPNQEHVTRAYFFDGTTVDLGRDKSLLTKLKENKERVPDEVSRLFANMSSTVETFAEDGAKALQGLFITLGLFEGEGTVVGRLHEGFMGKYVKDYSRYWIGPGILNFGIKLFERDGKKLQFAELSPKNLFLKNSTFIAGDGHNIICDDYRNELKTNPNLKSYKIHLIGYSRGGIIALDIAKRIADVTGCHFTEGRRPEIASLVMIDPVRTAMGIIDFLSLTWANDSPKSMNRNDVLILEKTIEHQDLADIPFGELIQLSILKTQKLRGVQHKFILGDGIVLANGKNPGGPLDAHIDHFQISHNQRAAIETMKFMHDRGGCFSIPQFLESIQEGLVKK